MSSGLEENHHVSEYMATLQDATGMNGEKERMPNSSVFGPQKTRRLNMIAICSCIVGPWLLFSFLYSVMSFSVHHSSPSLAWSLVFVALGVAFLFGILAIKAIRNYHDPLWYIYGALACFVAVFAAVVLGDMNFTYNMKPFYDIEHMNTYPAVRPDMKKGQQLMDAGHVYFAAGTGIDMKRAMGFKSRDLYCVAPIVIGNEQMASYDFWAVGTNCCSSEASDFRCGEYNNPHARSGMRMMRDDQRPFFRLAVQKAEAAYNIHAAHPLFFYWMEDPMSELFQYQQDGLRYFLMGICGSLVINTCSVVSVVVFWVIVETGLRR